jgi:hypothetical protein
VWPTGWLLQLCGPPLAGWARFRKLAGPFEEFRKLLVVPPDTTAPGACFTPFPLLGPSPAEQPDVASLLGPAAGWCSPLMCRLLPLCGLVTTLLAARAADNARSEVVVPRLLPIRLLCPNAPLELLLADLNGRGVDSGAVSDMLLCLWRADVICSLWPCCCLPGGQIASSLCVWSLIDRLLGDWCTPACMCCAQRIRT